MKFKRSIHVEKNLPAIAIVPLANILFLLLIFVALSSSLISPLTIDVKFPKAMTSDVVQEDNFVITITGENVLYIGRQIIAIKDLKERMERLTNKQDSVLIKADPRASVGRVVDVWNLCRALGIERVNIATSQEQ